MQSTTHSGENAMKPTPTKTTKNKISANPISSFFGKAANVNAAPAPAVVDDEIAGQCESASPVNDSVEISEPAADMRIPEDCVVKSTPAKVVLPVADVPESGMQLEESTVAIPSTPHITAGETDIIMHTPAQQTVEATETAAVSPADIVMVGDSVSPSTAAKPSSASKVLPVITDNDSLRYIFHKIHDTPTTSMENATKFLLEGAKADDAAPAAVKGASKALLERTLKLHADNGITKSSPDAKKKAKVVKVWAIKAESWALIGEEPVPLAAIVPAAETASSPTETPAASPQTSSNTANIANIATITSETPTQAPKAAVAPVKFHYEPEERAFTAAGQFLAVLKWALTKCLGFSKSEAHHDMQTDAHSNSLDSAALVASIGELLGATLEKADADLVPSLVAAKLDITQTGLALLRQTGAFATAEHVKAMVDAFATEWNAAHSSTDVAASTPIPLPEKLLAHFVHGSAATLSALSHNIASMLNSAGCTPAISAEYVSTAIPLIAGRSAYGVKPSSTLPKNDDASLCYLWRWEVAKSELLLLPESTSAASSRNQIKADDRLRKILAAARAYVQNLFNIMEAVYTGPKSSKKVDDWNAKVAASEEKVVDSMRKFRCEFESLQKQLEDKAKKEAEKLEKSAEKQAAIKAPKSTDAKASPLPKSQKAAAGTPSLFSFFKTPSAKPTTHSTPATASPAVVQLPVTPLTGGEISVITRVKYVHQTSCASHLPKSRVFQDKLQQRLEAEKKAASPENWESIDNTLGSSMPKSEATRDFEAWCIQSRNRRATRIAMQKQGRREARMRAIESIQRNMDVADWASRGLVDLTKEPRTSFLQTAASNSSLAAQLLASPGVCRVKLLHFHRDNRPAYFGTWRAKHAARRIHAASEPEPEPIAADEEDERYLGVREPAVNPEQSEQLEDGAPYISSTYPTGHLTPRYPLVADHTLFNYDVDSEAEWEDGDNADDVTDLEQASDNEEEDEEEEEVVKDDGRADAKGYDYSDEWLCADDECDYVARDSDIAMSAAGENGEQDNDVAAPAAKRQRLAPNQCAADESKLRELYAPNVDGSSDVVLGPFGSDEMLEYVNGGVYPATMRSKSTRQRAWFREMVDMRCQGLPESRLCNDVTYVSPPGGDSSVLQVCGLPFSMPLFGDIVMPTPVVAEQQSSEGGTAPVVKKQVPAELLPELVNIVHGHLGGLEKIHSAWKEMLRSTGRDENTVSVRQLNLKIAEIAVRGRWFGPNGKPVASASLSTATASGTVTPADGPKDSAEAEASATSTNAGGSVEHVQLEPYVLAVIFGEKCSQPAAAAFNKSRYVVKDDVLTAVGFHYQEPVREFASKLIATVVEKNVDNIARAMAPESAQVSGKKRKTPDTASAKTKAVPAQDSQSAAKSLFQAQPGPSAGEAITIDSV